MPLETEDGSTENKATTPATLKLCIEGSTIGEKTLRIRVRMGAQAPWIREAHY